MKKLTLEEVSEKHLGKYLCCVNAHSDNHIPISENGVLEIIDGNYRCVNNEKILMSNLTFKNRGNLIVTHVLIWK